MYIYIYVYTSISVTCVRYHLVILTILTIWWFLLDIQRSPNLGPFRTTVKVVCEYLKTYDLLPHYILYILHPVCLDAVWGVLLICEMAKKEEK